MKRMLIFAGLAAAILFLPAGCSLEFLDGKGVLDPVGEEPKPGALKRSLNWKTDGTYVVNIRNVQSYMDAIKLMAVRTGQIKYVVIFPTSWTRLDAAQYCRTVGMTLSSFDGEKEIFACMGI